MRLGVNIDHVATLREARKVVYPDPVKAAHLALEASADLITAHLREDRRHIQEDDIWRLKKAGCPLNLEMAATEAMLYFALEVNPQDVCLVPEKREELTTEGGLDLEKNQDFLYKAIAHLQDQGIKVAVFIEPEKTAIDMAKALGVKAIELHTGTYANAITDGDIEKERMRIENAAYYAKTLGLEVHGGHGLHYENVQAIAAIQSIEELNIGHAIVAEAVFIGISQAVALMKQKISNIR